MKILSLLNRQFNRKAYALALIIILLFGVGVRLAALYLEPTVWRDGIECILLAKKWIDGGEFPRTSFLPFFIYLMTLLMRAGMSGVAAGLTINIVLGSLLPLVVYGIVRVCVARREIALAAALLMAVNPIMIELAINIQRDVGYLFFTGCAIFFGLYAVKGEKWWSWGICGVFLAMGVFTRYEALELVPLIGLYFLVAPFCRAVRWRTALKGAAIWLAFFCLSIICLAWLMDVFPQMERAYHGRIERIWRKQV